MTWLVVAIAYWIAGIMYTRQITTMYRRWYQWIIFAILIVVGCMFAYGFALEVL